MVDLIFGLSEIFIVVSYIFRDILILRIVSILGMSGYVSGAFVAGYTEPGMKALIMFSALAVLVNLVQVVKLLAERHPILLSDDVKGLYKCLFSSMTTIEFHKLYVLSHKHIFKQGQFLAEQDKPVDELIAINKGHASIIKDGKIIAQISEGFFVGEMSFLTGDMATATVRADDDVECVVWRKDLLYRFEISKPEIYNKLKQDISINLIKKIQRPRLEQ